MIETDTIGHHIAAEKKKLEKITANADDDEVPVEYVGLGDRIMYLQSELSISRLSLSIAEPRIDTSASDSEEDAEVKRVYDTLFNVVVYGTYFKYESMELNESELDFNVGCIKIYGNRWSKGKYQLNVGDQTDHVELFSCGRSDVDGYKNFDHSNVFSNDLAISLKMSSVVSTVLRYSAAESKTESNRKGMKGSRDSNTNTPVNRSFSQKSNEGNENTTEAEIPSTIEVPKRRHVIIELSVATCNAYWDHSSMLFLRNIGLSMMLAVLPASNIIEEHRFIEYRRILSVIAGYGFCHGSTGNGFSRIAKQVQSVNDLSIKYSIEVVMKGLVVSVPCYNYCDDIMSNNEAVLVETDFSPTADANDVDFNGANDDLSIYGSESSDATSSDDDSDPGHTRWGRQWPDSNGGNSLTPNFNSINSSSKTMWNDPITPNSVIRRSKSSLKPSVFPKRCHSSDKTIDPENAKVLQLRIGAVSISSGDFLDAHASTIRQQHATKSSFSPLGESVSGLNTNGLSSPTWVDQADGNICNIYDKQKNPTVRCFWFECKAVDALFVQRKSRLDSAHVARHDHDCCSSISIKEYSKFEPVKFITNSAWAIKGLVTQAELPYHRAYTNNRIDVLFSPLLVSLSTQVCHRPCCIFLLYVSNM